MNIALYRGIAFGLLITAVAVLAWMAFKKQPIEQNFSVDDFHKKETIRLNRELTKLQSESKVWQQYVKQLNDSLTYEKRKTKIIHEKYIRLRNSYLPIYTDAQLDSAINKLLSAR